MTDQEKKDIAIKRAGELLVEAFPAFYGAIKFNLQGKRKSVHANVVQEIGVEISENKQFLEPLQKGT